MYAGNDGMDEAERHRLWVSRTANTAAHEGLHTFGVDHCAFYACLMNACSPEPTYVPYSCLEKGGGGRGWWVCWDLRLCTTQ